MTTELDVFIRGIPHPKGSKRIVPAGGRSGGRPIMIDNNPKGLRDWESAVRFTVQQAWQQPPLAGPVGLRMEFYFLRPASVSERTRQYPTVAPDDDKLARAATDPLEGVVVRNDAQVVRRVVSKDYGDTPGLRLVVFTPEGSQEESLQKPWLERDDDGHEDVVEGLVQMGIKKQQAKSLTAGLKGTKEEMMRQALARRDEELR